MKIKKLLILLSVFVLVMTTAIGCTSLSNSENGTATSKTEDSIIGEWKMKPIEDSGVSMSLDIKYVFEKDGVGSIEALGEKFEFTYSISGDQLSLTMTNADGEVDTESGKFSIDGDTLSLIDDEETVEFERVK